jgi:hypothetical protein
MSDQGCYCAHLNVIYDKGVCDGRNILGEVVPNGANYDIWRCRDCGQPFWPQTAPTSAPAQDCDVCDGEGEVDDECQVCLTGQPGTCRCKGKPCPKCSETGAPTGEVTRYFSGLHHGIIGMWPSAEGKYVLHSDYIAKCLDTANAERDTLRAMLKRIGVSSSDFDCESEKYETTHYDFEEVWHMGEAREKNRHGKTAAKLKAAESDLVEARKALKLAVNGYEPLLDFARKVGDEFDSEEPYHPLHSEARGMSAHVMGVKIAIEEALGGDPMKGPSKLNKLLSEVKP